MQSLANLNGKWENKKEIQEIFKNINVSQSKTASKYRRDLSLVLRNADGPMNGI